MINNNNFHFHIFCRLLTGILSVCILIGCNSDDSMVSNSPLEKEVDTISIGEFKNPVFQPVFADPSVVKGDDGYFYAYATEDDWGKGDVHLVPIIRSTDLVNWDYVTDAFETKPTWKDHGFIWAPDVTKVDGKFYMYYSYSLWGDSDPGVGLAISDKPEGPFEDQGKLFISSEVGVSNSIDPFYIEDDGKKYLFWGSFHGIYGIRLTDDGKAIDGEKFQVAGDFMEATYIYPKDGYYYLFGSAGTCCDGANSTYKVVIGRSENVEGPYVSKEGNSFINTMGSILLDANATGGYAGPGHNAELITDDEGNDWILYHAISKTEPYLPAGATKRPLMLEQIIWKDGWPTIKNNQPGTGVQNAPVFE